MKVSIFGASGATGRLLTERCLARGYEVTVLLRTPSKFALRDRVRVVEGSIFDYGTVVRAVDWSEVVLSALGARTLGKEEVLERAVPLMVEAMRAAGVRRLIALGSAGAKKDSLSKQPAWRRWLVENFVYTTLLKWPVASQVAQWNYLSNSGLDWTMVMPPMLTNGRGRGLEKVRVDGEALPRNGSRIAREDVADFMMEQIEDLTWLRQGVYIAY